MSLIHQVSWDSVFVSRWVRPPLVVLAAAHGPAHTPTSFSLLRGQSLASAGAPRAMMHTEMKAVCRYFIKVA